jgi:competence protein ComEC
MSELTLLCCAYVLGLLCAARLWATVLLVSLLLGMALLRSHLWQFPIPESWRKGPMARWWAIATLISLFATAYIQIATPHPASNDISYLINPPQTTLAAQVRGNIESRPALTRRGSFQFWLNATEVISEHRTVSGKLYVTLPRKTVKNLHPGQSVTVSGQLYRPQSTKRPHGFDFAAFLSRDSAFAGLKGTQVRIDTPGSTWGGWALRERIVRSLQKGTDARTGALLGALVLGKDAADVPYDLRGAFVQVGLAHALAASGFQVSLILSSVLTLGRALPTSQQILLGASALLFYGFLSGAEPSIVRAILMGFAGLAALGLQRQTRPVGVLLAIATLMLLYNPLWIWDLGFQLSVLATLGLLVTVPPLVATLDRLPPVLATAIAVPLAATLWTLPLQIYTFGILSLYSLFANVLTAFLLSILTIGGFIGSCLALLWPDLGSLVAWFLLWPTQLLIGIVMGISQLPGHALAIGSISLLQLLGLYGCIGAVWLLPRWQRQWRLMAVLGILILVVPLWQVQTQRFLVTVFDHTRTPMMVIEHPNGTVVLNSGDALNASQSLVPFLQQEGINRVDWAIATQPDDPLKSGWTALLQKISITNLSRCIPQAFLIGTTGQPKRQIDVNPQEKLTLGPIQMILWRAQPTILELQIGPQKWWMVDGSNESDFLAWLATVQFPQIQVLWWTGEPLSPSVAEQLHPQVAILSGRKMTPSAIAALKTVVPKVLWTEQDGTVQWTPEQGFSSTVNPGDNNLSVL